MISTLFLVSSLSLGFPEVPVGPVGQPLVSQQEDLEVPNPEVEEIEVEPGDVQEVEPELFDEDQALRDQAARDQALRERQQAMEPARGDDDWARDEEKQPALPVYQIRALATATLPVRTENTRGRQGTGEFLVGARLELDILRASLIFSWDRGGLTPISLSETLTDTNYWNGLIGPSVWVTRHGRIRLLGGLSAVSTPRAVQFGPTLGLTARLGIPVISVEGAVLYTPIGFMQVDARAELVLRLLIFEVRGGYRGRLLDTERSGAGEQVPVESTGGPTVSLGLVF